MACNFRVITRHSKHDFRLWAGIVIALAIFVTSSLAPAIGLAAILGQRDTASHTEMMASSHEDMAGMEEPCCEDCEKTGACENSALCATACSKISFYHPADCSLRWASSPYFPQLAPENHWAEHIPSLLKRPPKSV